MKKHTSSVVSLSIITLIGLLGLNTGFAAVDRTVGPHDQTPQPNGTIASGEHPKRLPTTCSSEMAKLISIGSLVIDRLEGQMAVVFSLEDDNKPDGLVVPLPCLPEGIVEGDWLRAGRLCPECKAEAVARIKNLQDELSSRAADKGQTKSMTIDL